VNTSHLPRYLLALLFAVLLAAAWGSIVQSQSNLSVLATLGAQVDFGTRAGVLLRDLGIFGPFYAGVFVLPALLVGFALAGLLAGWMPRLRTVLFVLAGGVALMVAIPLINWVAPLALLIIATRDLGVVAMMASGGLFAGLLFAKATADARLAT
jgi:hypothetical protein